VGTVEATPGYRMNVLIRRRAGVSRDELVANWFANHMPAVVRGMAAPNVQSAMKASGGFRYVIAQSVEPQTEEFAGMAELYFPDAEAWERFRKTAKPDGMERWTDPDDTLLFTSRTEMVGIPG
jgi:hypothetical protein